MGKDQEPELLTGERPTGVVRKESARRFGLNFATLCYAVANAEVGVPVHQSTS